MIFSVFSLEHLDSKVTFDRVLEDVIRGTRKGGINCFIISTNITETLLEIDKKLDPMFELLFGTEEFIEKLQLLYREWTLVKHTVKPYDVEIKRDGRRILLHGDVVTWAVQNPIR